MRAATSCTICLCFLSSLGAKRTAVCIALAPDEDWVLTAGHRMELLQYHTHVLEHMGSARWELSTVPE